MHDTQQRVNTTINDEGPRSKSRETSTLKEHLRERTKREEGNTGVETEAKSASEEVNNVTYYKDIKQGKN